MVEPTGPGMYVDPAAEIAESAVVGPRAVLGPRCRVESGAEVRESVLLEGCVAEMGAQREPARSSPPAPGSRAGAALDGAVVGSDERVPGLRGKGADDRRRSAMLDDVLAIPDHLRDALWRVESARLEAADSAGLLVCGMGGSAIGGDLAAAALGERLARPLATVRGYRLPRLGGADWTVLCSSYSGGTEETLACFEAATEARRAADRRQHRRRPRRPRPARRASRWSACRASCSRGPRSPTCSSSRPRPPRWPGRRRGSHAEIEDAAALLERRGRRARGAARRRSPSAWRARCP